MKIELNMKAIAHNFNINMKRAINKWFGEQKNARSFAGLKTNVIAEIFDEHGTLIHTQQSANTITDGDPDTVHNGLVFLLDRLFDNGDHYDPDDKITTMQLGTGTPTDAGLGTPIAASAAVFTTVAFDETGGSWYADPIIQANKTWTASDPEWTGITEAGIFSTGTETSLFAFKTFTPALVKPDAGSLSITWEVQANYTAP
jgi:hypothetical protein